MYEKKERILNFPFDKIHDAQSAFGRLVFPWTKGRWLAWFRCYGFRLTSKHGFHNCTKTGIY